jgi:putative nucleotidyltransferase-like protein
MPAPVSTENSLLQTMPKQKHRQPTEWQVLLECGAPSTNVDRLADLLQNSFNWPNLLRRAEDHGVVPLVAERLANLDPTLIPLEVRARFRESRRSYTACSLQMTAELFHVLERLAETGIETLATKGPVLSVRCYGDPGMRQYSDLDLVIREKDIRRATQAMLDLTYEPRVPLTAIDVKKIPGEYAFRKPSTQLLLEFHTERTFRYHPRPLQIEKLFERRAFVSIDSRDVPALSPEDELVLICVHGAKHFWERLMWIADVAALISAKQPPDWDRAMAAAREVGAERILRLGLRLASDVLGAKLPVQVDANVRSDRVVSKLAAQIESRLGSGDPCSIGILQRAAFRVRMRDGLLAGAAYLLRLSLSPTEEDWTPGNEGNRPVFLDAISRPLRLARKHRRRSSS